MAKTLTGTEFCKAQYIGQEIASAGSAAYWLECRSGADAASYHRDKIEARVKEICDLLGLRVVDDAEVV